MNVKNILHLLIAQGTVIKMNIINNTVKIASIYP